MSVVGSAFPKAKPKHGLFKVTRQAISRFLFLPLYHAWWTEQTTARLFWVFLTLYCAQIFVVVIHLNLVPYWLFDVFNNGTVWNAGQQSVVTADATVSGPSPLDTGVIVISDIQTSEILSPIFLMIVLTILHSQIVATYGSKSDDSRSVRNKRYRPRRNSGSATALGKQRSKRRTSRYSQNHRRRSNVKTGATLSREGSQESCLQSPGSRKVFFQDESKSWTSSNSDKDEGIVDENHESGENEPEGLSCRRRLSKEVQNIVGKNIIEANLNATIKKFTEEEELAIRQQNEEAIILPTKEDLELCDIPVEANILPDALRSNLRKRNISKISEVSTTSCADCSSNNNDSTTEDEYREANVEDEEMRSKSEWTAVTTNSEDDYDDDNINSEDEDEMTETQLHDHPFAWEFQKVIIIFITILILK